MLLLGLKLYLNHRDRQKSAQIERESKQTIPKPSESLNLDYGRYIQAKQYDQIPKNGAKKIFYRPSDVYLFLVVK
ncbi:hypothetical protein JavanS342_0004 [Streptococcus satellite phage Javan342]|nr:hypothetical protein JavanS342_0004 [Streptococcus satellite phage Javan342]